MGHVDAPYWGYNSYTIAISILECGSRWVCLYVCSSAIETTFHLSNFKTKHIFGTLMAQRKFKTIWVAQGTPIFFNFVLIFFTGRRNRHSRRTRETRLKRLFCEFKYKVFLTDSLKITLPIHLQQFYEVIPHVLPVDTFGKGQRFVIMAHSIIPMK